MDEIANLTLYNQRMAKPLIDKMFFADKIDADVIVDYGCADGTVLQALHTLFPQHTYIGFDTSPEMITLAQSHSDPAISYYHDWDALQRQCDTLQSDGKRICVTLLSVIHEVYHYGNPDEVEQFWQRIFGGRFDTVAVRDMMVATATTRPADPLSVARIRQVYDPERLGQWERQWGSINENWSLVHFLLTYRYVDNWQRELHENYLPQAVERFLRRIPAHYMPIYHEHFIPPFLRRQVQQDFGITVPDPTHLKLIVERKIT